ncbi:DUF1561 family protein, partial [Helicobacter sp. 13S00477-4]|uniref:DUF1561 family protein n=1 Tax=Helicobacter sp. 13S00477-4 TaxID=1905759 RepID=UPI001179D01A
MNSKLLSLLPLIIFGLFNTLSADSVPQKLTDKPIDKSIHIKTHDKGNYCYAPVFTKGEAYIYIDDCSS